MISSRASQDFTFQPPQSYPLCCCSPAQLIPRLWVWTRGSRTFPGPVIPHPWSPTLLAVATCTGSWELVHLRPQIITWPQLVNAPVSVPKNDSPHIIWWYQGWWRELGFGIIFAGPPKSKTIYSFSASSVRKQNYSTIRHCCPVSKGLCLYVVSKVWMGRAPGAWHIGKPWDGRNNDSKVNAMHLSSPCVLVRSAVGPALMLLQDLGQWPCSPRF